VEKIAQNRATVLITKKNGSGKELIAKANHFNGIRKNHPFVSINCAAIPGNFFESNLFGYEK
jgi:transcriptional regulator with PAS, ATPase and Fis domain